MRSKIQTAAIAAKVFAFLRIAAPVAAFCGVAILYQFADDMRPLAADLARSIALVGLFVFPVAAYFAADGCFHMLRARMAKGWPTAMATVLSSGVGTSYASYGMFFFAPKVSYRYEVGGIAYEGSSIQSTRVAYASEEKARDISARFPMSAEVAVHYDPQDPSEAVLDLGDDAARRRIVIGLLAFCAPVVVGGLINWLNSLG